MNRFDANYDLTATQIDRIELVRLGFSVLEGQIETLVGGLSPREKALVMTKLEEACLWAVKAISKEPKA